MAELKVTVETVRVVDENDRLVWEGSRELWESEQRLADLIRPLWREHVRQTLERLNRESDPKE